MKCFTTLPAIIFFIISATAQPGRIYTHQFKLSVDEDFINIRGKGTDKGYTGGIHLDYIYTPKKISFFVDRWLPKAGADAVNTFGVGVSHMMFTPTDLSASQPLPGNYAYAGALIVRHLLNSSDPERKYNLQSQITAGVMGPSAFADEIQIFLHRAIGDEKPMGWDNQLPDDILLNFQLSAEKQMAGSRHFEIIGGAKAAVGTMYNAAGLYLFTRAGWMNPYFSGLLTHNGIPRNDYRKRMQFYFHARPGLQAVGYNSLLQGGLLLSKRRAVAPGIYHLVGFADYGMTLACRNFSISFTQTTLSPLVEGMSSHETGNISLYFSW